MYCTIQCNVFSTPWYLSLSTLESTNQQTNKKMEVVDRAIQVTYSHLQRLLLDADNPNRKNEISATLSDLQSLWTSFVANAKMWDDVQSQTTLQEVMNSSNTTTITVPIPPGTCSFNTFHEACKAIKAMKNSRKVLACVVLAQRNTNVVNVGVIVEKEPSSQSQLV